MQLTLKQVVILPGQQLRLQDISWQQFEELLEDWGEGRSARVVAF